MLCWTYLANLPDTSRGRWFKQTKIMSLTNWISWVGCANRVRNQLHLKLSECNLEQLVPHPAIFTPPQNGLFLKFTHAISWSCNYFPKLACNHRLLLFTSVCVCVCVCACACVWWERAIRGETGDEGKWAWRLGNITLGRFAGFDPGKLMQNPSASIWFGKTLATDLPLNNNYKVYINFLPFSLPQESWSPLPVNWG